MSLDKSRMNEPHYLIKYFSKRHNQLMDKYLANIDEIKRLKGVIEALQEIIERNQDD